MFFKHFDSKNQLPGLSIIGTLIENELINEETSFVRLRKFRTSCAVSTKSVTLHILWHEAESSQNASLCIQNSF